MVSCAVRTCPNRSGVDKKQGSGITFHRFPSEKSPVRRQKWIDFVGRGAWKPSKYSVLCCKHFEEKFFDRSSICVVRLRDNAVPTIDSCPRTPYQVGFVVNMIINPVDTTSESAPSVFSSVKVESVTVSESRSVDEATEMAASRRHEMKRKVYRLIEVTNNRKRKLNLLKRKCLRQRKRIVYLEKVLSNLKKENLPPEYLESLEMIYKGGKKHR